MPIDPVVLTKQIDHLWSDLAEQSEGDERTLVRACSLTLVVLADAEENAADVSEALAELIETHPNRAIVVRVSAGDSDRLEADVRAHCWMPTGRRQQICSEQIEVEASEASLTELPSVLLPLIVPDLPAILWCRSERASRSPAFRELRELAPRVIMDIEKFGRADQALSHLAQHLPGDVTTDLSWTRLTRWREMVAQAFENPACRCRVADFRDIVVSYRANVDEGIPASVFLMAGWLVNSLGWKWTGASVLAGEDPVLRLSHAGAEARVSFRCAGDGGAGSRLARLELASEGKEPVRVTLEREEDHLEIQVEAVNSKPIGMRVWFPPSQDGPLMGEELRILQKDPIFESSLNTAAKIAALLG